MKATAASMSGLAAIFLLAAAGQPAATQGALTTGASNVDFARDVQPIFREHCFECHGPAQQMRGLRFDLRRVAMPNRVGANGATIVPGDSGGSRLYRAIAGGSGLQMPPAGRLTPEKIAMIKAWIDQGAEWPDANAGDIESPGDPAAVPLVRAVRSGNRRAFAELLRQDPSLANRRGPGGWTPLMYIAIYGDAATMRTLLDAGADIDLVNDNHATALMYAVESLEMTRLLLEYGADPHRRSDEGRTALLIAASIPGATSVVSLLLDYGADPNARGLDGRTPLAAATIAGNAALVRLLADRGAIRKPLPLAQATRNCLECLNDLIAFADPDDLTGALTNAVAIGDPHVTGVLLERGARAAPDALERAAMSSLPLPLLRTLVARGAEVNRETRLGGTLIDLAERQGDTPLVHLLNELGVAGASSSRNPPPLRSSTRSVRDAIERSIPMLQRADVAFLDRAGCVSCHNNSLVAMALATARAHGIQVDEEIANRQTQRIAVFLGINREAALEKIGVPGAWDTSAYTLAGMAAAGYAADSITDAWARYLKSSQSRDGHWRVQATRPPLESSDIQITATALRGLQTYALTARRADYADAIRRAARWLEEAHGSDTEDRAFQLLGLKWGAGSRSVTKAAGLELIATQHPDGGWSQLPSMPSDAYATGQALVALSEAGVLRPADVRYQRGVRFLLDSQREDGTWYVRTRTLPIQPYFDSDFPYGRDQFISTAATSWAAMALAPAVR